MSKSKHDAINVEPLYRTIIERGSWESILDDLIHMHGYQMSDALLLMPDFPEECSQEFYTVCHFLEGEDPKSRFFRRVLMLSEEMNTICPDRLQFLIRRAIRSDEYYPSFLTQIKRLTSGQREVVSSIVNRYLEDLRQYPDKVFESRCSQVLANTK